MDVAIDSAIIGADLCRQVQVNLEMADLSNADLTNCDLTEAYMTGAVVNGLRGVLALDFFSCVSVKFP